jgi:hypothetical protein
VEEWEVEKVVTMVHHMNVVDSQQDEVEEQ